jgi:hypothetical protein
MRTTPRTAKAKALLRAERARAAQKGKEPQRGNLLSNPNPTPKSSKSGPGGSPLYNAEQKDLIKEPTVKKNGNGKVPPVKKPAGQPSTAPLYDANQSDLTDPKALSGKPQETLKGASKKKPAAKKTKMSVIARIRQRAARAAR